MTFDCLLLESPDGPLRPVAMRVDLFVDVEATADPISALNAFASVHGGLAYQWTRTVLVDGRCTRTRAAALAHAGPRDVQAIDGGVEATPIAQHLFAHWGPGALCADTFTLKRVVVCLDGWATGEAAAATGHADCGGDGPQLADANPSEIKRSARSRFGRKRYVRPP